MEGRKTTDHIVSLWTMLRSTANIHCVQVEADPCIGPDVCQHSMQAIVYDVSRSFADLAEVQLVSANGFRIRCGGGSENKDLRKHL